MDNHQFAAPSDGVYLLEMELTTDVPGIANSEPYWIVFNLNTDQTVQDAAIVYVETVLVPGVPTPLAKNRNTKLAKKPQNAPG